METMTDKINKMAAALVQQDGSEAPLTRRDNVRDCKRGDLIELDGGRMMIFTEHCGDKFKAIDKRTNVLYMVPNKKLLRIAQGGHRPDLQEDWQETLKPGDLFYIFRQGRCELYQLTERTATHLLCIVPHTEEEFRIRRGEYEGRRINGSLD